jgi:hypothetical protein
VSCQGGGIDRSLPPILVLGLGQTDLYLISDEILSLSFSMLSLSFQLVYLIIFIFLVGLSLVLLS